MKAAAIDRENPSGGAANRSLYIPQEIIEEILTRLPVKSLLRFRCVSKSWLRLIGSDRFVKIQLQKSRDDTTFAHWRVILKYTEPHEPSLMQCSKRSFMEESSPHPSPIEDPTNNNRPLSASLVDCCNGVLCILRKESSSFILFNPATRIFHQLPELNKDIDRYGFGWDETSDAYKVLAVMSDSSYNIHGGVYSTKTNSWRTIENWPRVRFFVYSRRGKFACGKIHWLMGFYNPRIVSFDLKSEVFGAIELPFQQQPFNQVMYRHMHKWLSETTEGCLAVYTNNNKDDGGRCDKWIMKEYGVKESWVKESWHEFNSCYKIHSYYESLVSPVPHEHGPTQERVLL